VDAATGQVACGSRDALRVFDELPWITGDGEQCPICAATVGAIPG
jgi:hypothetical protein